mmetsp:Transcript_12602/g.30499  ORF Transcript_12602/g.30499 Transcript_12602/m.30499 type:complete len:281 (+) Transcript_12602:155-997(+)
MAIPIPIPGETKRHSRSSTIAVRPSISHAFIKKKRTYKKRHQNQEMLRTSKTAPNTTSSQRKSNKDNKALDDIWKPIKTNKIPPLPSSSWSPSNYDTTATTTNITITKSNDRFTTNSMPARHLALQIPERKVSLCPTSSHDARCNDETSSTTPTLDRLLPMDSEKTEPELDASSSAPVSKSLPATPLRTGSRFLLADQVDEGGDDDSFSFLSDEVNSFQKSISPKSVMADIMTNPHHQPRRAVLLQKCNITTAAAAVAAKKHDGDDDDDDACDEYLSLSS